MRDLDVRRALHNSLGQGITSSDDTLVVDELGLCGSVRVDVAVVNGILSGYELKSERDSIRRLPQQAEVYSRVLDHAVLVAAERHIPAARKLIPRWWGITSAVWSDDGSLDLRTIRQPKMNPRIDPYSLAQLLWRDEVLEELTIRGLAAGYRSKPRIELWNRVADTVGLDELRQIVRDRLRQRPRWRVAPSRSADGV